MTRLPRLLLILSLLLAGAHAQADETARAKAHFVKGEAHFSLGEFRAALDEYRRAYLLRPLPPLLFNMAQCHRHLGELERAGFLLRRFLESKPAAAQREQAQAVLAIVEAALKSSPASVPASQRAPVKQGPSPLAATRPVRLPPPAVRGPVVDPTPPPIVRRGTPLHRRWWFWAAIGGVATGVAVGVAIAATRGSPPGGSLPAVDWR